MADIYTSREDELLIAKIINDGFNHNMHKYYILRLALAKSTQMPNFDDLDDYLNIKGDGRKEYLLKQVTGENSQEEDYDKEIRVLLGYLHNLNLFENDSEYKKLLQKHIRRGLAEIDRSWKSSDSFYEYIYQDMLEAISIEENSELDIIEAIDRAGIKAELVETIEASRLTHYKIRVLNSEDINNFKKITNGQLNSILGVKEIILKDAKGEPLTFILTLAKDENSWREYDYFIIKKWIKEIPNSYKLGVFLGVDIYDNPYYFDLKDAPHIFIAGATGSGKSVTLHLLIISLMQKSSNEVEFVLIDPKKVELNLYAQTDKLSQISDKKIITDNENILEVLSKLELEMDSRYSLLEEKGVQNINDLQNGELKNIVVVIEELADILMSGDKTFNKECERILGRLAQKARAAGIHLVLVTQRPSSEVLPGILRTNVPSRIALKVSKSTESKIILDEVGAEKLVGKGDCLVKIGPSEIERVHSVYLKNENIKELI
ncbi:MAG: FtsK/SpoIIIE domain-containing protein [Sulfurimonadaceae bacterium]|jgi:S-DNA-T family DNA segregation ATPase FtsK/SpoIIIE|nr:FtsK/SpoIIIE domain-containing protein [Sulfurimonadaceae bacterium]